MIFAKALRSKAGRLARKELVKSNQIHRFAAGLN